MRQLLDNGANIEARNRTVLMIVANMGHKTIVQQLLDRGADIKATDNYGRTALFYAATNGHDTVVQQLDPEKTYRKRLARNDSEGRRKKKRSLDAEPCG